MSDLKKSWFEELSTALAERRESGLLRELTPRGISIGALNLADNDYRGLAHDPIVIEAAVRATKTWGTSSSASPLITGYKQIHHDLEDALCSHIGFPSAMLWNTGYAANHAVLSALCGKDVIVLADRLIHNSMIQGLMHSGSRIQRYRHCDLGHLEEKLRESADKGKRVFVVTESVFSMDGDWPDLNELARLKEQYGFVWILDEAHAIGWHGENGAGLAAQCGVTAHVDVLIGTLGKALGAMGAFTLFNDAAVRGYLTNFAGEFIYSTYLAPANAAAAMASLELLTQREDERLQLLDRSTRFRKLLSERLAFSGAITDFDSPIVPVPVGDAEKVVALGQSLLERGFLTGAIRPPTVPPAGSRLRISLKPAFDDTLMARFIKTLEDLSQ